MSNDNDLELIFIRNLSGEIKKMALGEPFALSVGITIKDVQALLGRY